MRSTLVHEVEELVSRVGTHPVWGYGHCRRVSELARELALAERLEHDAEILHLAALLHDIGLYKAYNMREAPDHAERSAIAADRILKDADFPPRARRVIVDAVRHHPPGSRPGSSVEGALLKDAVALDYLGAVGVSRVLAMVGLEEEVPDIPAAIAHARSLHRTIPDLLIFESSRAIARERALETEGFLEDLGRSTGGLRLL
ncbi:metal dependent phosphohydrolase [Rubrobacter xylanophilus DSM 9941]|uniref:Metal dependent phosphohydrolase n=1 Tax=Rubrobacter xylanophilus (strain DSM 9941 / JCM 11954 / NBRC 16129 / PRD-1) TaxID=266117 RepID=Q1ARA9_RUBXD|nr:HD domain-containing protein [Rubrobacter xylanophilus]ABG06069.1 metal dependent phosphohydrolase [Rubrobacter xylanophilus DSM 9941]